MIVGSPEWSRTSHGSLTRSEQRAYARLVVTQLLAGLPDRLRFRLSSGADLLASFDTDAAPPDSALVRDAIARADEAYSPWMLGHCWRTWAFARLLGQVDGLKPDPEFLFLAALLHDLTLEPALAPNGTDDCECFALHGAHVSRDLLVELGAPADLAQAVGDAIGWHVNARVPSEAGPEAVLLSAGAALDVFGVRAASLGRAAVREVLHDHPRDGFVAGITAAVQREARERPSSRMAMLWKLGRSPALRLNPVN